MSMMSLCRAVVAGAAVWLAVVVSAESEPPAKPDAAPAQAAAPGISEAQRKNLLLANVPLGKDEGDGFWPLFRDYRRDMAKLQEQRAQAVAEYAETSRTMTGDQAKAMIELFLAADEGIVKVKRDYLKKFRKFLPETKVTRVFMIDERIDSALSAQLLSGVPVAGEHSQSQ
jgi:Spy/CpxP family protein refolding chaperone